MKFHKQDLPHSQISITVEEISPDLLARHAKKAWNSLTANISIPGFRKGYVPESMLKEMVSDERLKLQTLQNALPEIWRSTLEAHSDIHPIAEPELKVPSLEPLKLEWIISIFPQVTVGDYGAITIKKEKVEIKPEAVDAMIDKLKKQYFESNKKEESAETLAEFRKDMLGNEVTEDDFRKEIEVWLLKEAEQNETTRIENGYFDELLKLTSADLPPVMVEQEQQTMLEEIKRQVLFQGGSFDEYLRHIQKTEEDLRASFAKNAADRIKLRLALQEITKKEGIDVTDQEMADEIEKMVGMYDEAKRDELRKRFDKESNSYASLKNRMRMEKTLKKILPS